MNEERRRRRSFLLFPSHLLTFASKGLLSFRLIAVVFVRITSLTAAFRGGEEEVEVGGETPPNPKVRRATQLNDEQRRKKEDEHSRSWSIFGQREEQDEEYNARRETQKSIFLTRRGEITFAGRRGKQKIIIRQM